MANYGRIPAQASLKPKEFHVDIPQQQLDEFKQLLKLSKIGPKTYENQKTDRSFGTTRDWLSNAKTFWEEKYDWRVTEEQLNSFPHFTVPIQDEEDTYQIHFVGLFSEKSDAIPICLLHGWPGSFLEFLQLLTALQKKYPAKDMPYHVVVPSLPGYAFSSGPSTTKNFETADVARIMNKLMVGLGFENGYAVQGGDIGSMVARIMAEQSDSVKAVHLNFCPTPPPSSDDPMKGVDELEQKMLSRATAFRTTGDSYANEHGKRPGTIGLVLSSSPLALLAWIGEKFLEWTDTDPELAQVLDSVTLYWFTESFSRSIYPYRELFVQGKAFHSDPKYHCKKPLGYSFFPYEIAPMPKAWVATTGDLVWHKQHSTGGHFAAMEKPNELLNDIEEFLQQVWKR